MRATVPCSAEKGETKLRMFSPLSLWPAGAKMSIRLSQISPCFSSSFLLRSQEWGVSPFSSPSRRREREELGQPAWTRHARLAIGFGGEKEEKMPSLVRQSRTKKEKLPAEIAIIGLDRVRSQPPTKEGSVRSSRKSRKRGVRRERGIYGRAATRRRKERPLLLQPKEKVEARNGGLAPRVVEELTKSDEDFVGPIGREGERKGAWFVF